MPGTGARVQRVHPEAVRRVVHPYAICPFAIEITDIRQAGEPAGTQIVEGRILQISFRFTNHAGHTAHTLNGVVRYRGQAAPDAGPSEMNIVNLPVGGTGSGVLFGIAPLAAREVEIDLDFFEADAFPGAEFPPPTCTGMSWIDIAARFEIRIESFTVEEARSPLEDTLFGQCTALYGGQPLPSPHAGNPAFNTLTTQVESYGSHGDGSVVPTSFLFGPFQGVPGASPDIMFNFAFINSGFAGTGEEQLTMVLNWLADFGASAATLPTPIGAALLPLAITGLGLLYVIPNCDGVVAADQITMTSAALDQATREGGGYTEERRYPGSTSPVGCGANSRYRVKFTIARLSHFGL